jgi:BA14K-like protein
MISLKVLSTAAAIALVVPLMAPGESFAQNSGLAARQGGGAARQGGGGFAVRQGGGSGLVARQGGVPGQRYSGGGGYRGGYHRDGDRDRDRGFIIIPGAVAGAVIGGAIASQGYYAPGYSDDQYYDDSAAVAVAPQGGDDAVAYCMQTYRSYDPQSGTYLGFDGQQHPCP